MQDKFTCKLKTQTNLMNIHINIINYFNERKKMIPEINARIKLLKQCTEHVSYLETLKTNREDILQNYSFHFYILETAPLLHEYKKILNTRLTVSFMGPKKQPINKKIGAIIKNYLSIARKYIDVDVDHDT